MANPTTLADRPAAAIVGQAETTEALVGTFADVLQVHHLAAHQMARRRSRAHWYRLSSRPSSQTLRFARPKKPPLCLVALAVQAQELHRGSANSSAAANLDDVRCPFEVVVPSIGARVE